MPTTTPTPQIQPTPDAPPWVNQPEFVLIDGPNKGQTIRLVLLSALVRRWLMKAKNPLFVPAVLALHKALTGREDVVLYLATKEGTARAVGPKHSFDPYAGERRGRQICNPGLRLNEHGEYTNAYSRNSESALPPVPTGQAAALDYVGKVWGNGANPESAMDYNNYASMLAITCDLAAEIWGAEDVAKLHAVPEANAEPTNWPQLLEFRKTYPRTEWTVKQKNIVANEAETRMAVPGSTGVKESMAGELGRTVTHINKLIRDKDVAGKKAKTHTTAATSFPRSVSVGTAKS